jgi:L-ascorbate metabolism protein UlaG (beta-lactamase superfamily)
MEIIWHGHACFELKDDVVTIVTDPFDESLGLEQPQLQADIVTVSHDNPNHNAVSSVLGNYKVLDAPGEYEIKEIFIAGHAMYPPSTGTGNSAQTRNITFIYEMDNITICHMGDIIHVPTQSQVEAFDNVDILLIPVGGSKSLNAAQASEVISIIEPAIVIPMHYHLPNITISLDPLDKFLKEMGLPQFDPQAKLRISQRSLPIETQTIVLTPIS